MPTLPPGLKAQMEQLAARAAITAESERLPTAALTDNYHDLLNSVLWVLEEAGIPLPDPTSRETARTAWA